MNDVIDRILSTYQLMRPLDPDRVSDSRQRITRYIECLASAGQSDPQQLAVYGLAYLKELHEEQDPRFTGC
jgi:streptomycin 6-kinase